MYCILPQLLVTNFESRSQCNHHLIHLKNVPTIVDFEYIDRYKVLLVDSEDVKNIHEGRKKSFENLNTVQ